VEVEVLDCSVVLLFDHLLALSVICDSKDRLWGRVLLVVIYLPLDVLFEDLLFFSIIFAKLVEDDKASNDQANYET